MRRAMSHRAEPRKVTLEEKGSISGYSLFVYGVVNYISASFELEISIILDILDSLHTRKSGIPVTCMAI